MAPTPDFDVYKSYFNNPKFPTLPFALAKKQSTSTRSSCRRSEYFEKLIDGPFMKSNQKEIELHEDDPVVMEALFCYVYDCSYHEFYENTDSKLQFLADLYVAGQKYQVKGIEGNVAMYMDSILWYDIVCAFHSPPDPDTKDLLAALETTMAGTPSHDVVARRSMIRFCAAHIYELRQMPEFVTLLKEFGVLLPKFCLL
ncbi:hypothetical protein MBLNU13_g08657t2 [Cladosporium sp. NU13]